MNKHRVLEAYADGSPIGLIAESFKVTDNQILEFLVSQKEKSRFKRTFTDEFRRMIAERDMNGVARSTIASELKLNVNTVKKACIEFGQAIKEKATSDNAYTKISGDFKLDTCPSCESKRNNLVDDKTTYCMKCNSEHEYHDGYVFKINFEYIEE